MLIKNVSGFSIGNNMYRGYNLQVLRDEKRTNNKLWCFSRSYSHHTLIPIIEKLKKTRSVKSITLVCDNIYHTLQNLEYCKNEGINIITLYKNHCNETERISSTNKTKH
jgi:hypothetical protein